MSESHAISLCSLSHTHTHTHTHTEPITTPPHGLLITMMTEQFKRDVSLSICFFSPSNFFPSCFPSVWFLCFPFSFSFLFGFEKERFALCVFLLFRLLCVRSVCVRADVLLFLVCLFVVVDGGGVGDWFGVLVLVACI